MTILSSDIFSFNTKKLYLTFPCECQALGSLYQIIFPPQVNLRRNAPRFTKAILDLHKIALKQMNSLVEEAKAFYIKKYAEKDQVFSDIGT